MSSIAKGRRGSAPKHAALSSATATFDRLLAVLAASARGQRAPGAADEYARLRDDLLRQLRPYQNIAAEAVAMVTALPRDLQAATTAPVPGGEWDEFADRVHGALGQAIQRARGRQARPRDLARPVLADLSSATEALNRLSVLVACHVRALLGEPARLDIIPEHVPARQARYDELRATLLASLGRVPAIASAALRLARCLPPNLPAQADLFASDGTGTPNEAALTTLTAGGVIFPVIEIALATGGLDVPLAVAVPAHRPGEADEAVPWPEYVARLHAAIVVARRAAEDAAHDLVIPPKAAARPRAQQSKAGAPPGSRTFQDERAFREEVAHALRGRLPNPRKADVACALYGGKALSAERSLTRDLMRFTGRPWKAHQADGFQFFLTTD